MDRYIVEVKDVQKNHVETKIHSKPVTIIPRIEFSQNDAAMLKKVSGLADAFCRHCLLDAKQCMDPKRVSNGFEFTRKLENLIHLYDSLTGYHKNIDIKVMCPNSKKRQIC